MCGYKNCLQELPKKDKQFLKFFLYFRLNSGAPAPPKRWLKPTPTTSPFVEATNSNFTVTTTVTFNVSKQQQQQHHTSEIEIPPRSHVSC